jgi:hypothetical protein
VITEEELCKWQVLANACIHASKFAGMPWALRIGAMCPMRQIRLHLVVVGTDETLSSAMQALLSLPELKEAIRLAAPALSVMRRSPS